MGYPGDEVKTTAFFCTTGEARKKKGHDELNKEAMAEYTKQEAVAFAQWCRLTDGFFATGEASYDKFRAERDGNI